VTSYFCFLILGINGIVGRFTLGLGEGSFKDITCSSCSKFIFETFKIERRKKGTLGKLEEDNEMKKLH
jgi:hypothetical protein